VRVFENRVLRRIFGPKRDEVTGEWRKMHSGELHYWYSSPDIIRQIKSRRIKWTEHVARVGEKRKFAPLGRPRRRGEDGIKKELTEIDWKDVDWVQVA
jgi:hypothetical protein